MDGALELRLPYRAPCDVAGLVRFFSARAVPGVEQIDRDLYVRSVRLPGGPGVVALRAGDDGDVEAKVWLTDASDLDAAAAVSRCLLDLDTNPAPIVDVLGSDDLIGKIVQSAPGRRVPGHAGPTRSRSARCSASRSRSPAPRRSRLGSSAHTASRSRTPSGR